MEFDQFRLWDDTGRRMYLNAAERDAFRTAAKAQDDRHTRTFCYLLLLSGCRISEALETTPERIDWPDQAVKFRTLKKRCRNAATTYRAVPLPAEYLYELNLIHHLKGQGKADPKALLWTWSRATAWRRVKGVMLAAGIEGAQASPKGLRHSFGVVHAMNKTQINTLQRWMELRRFSGYLHA